MRGGNDGNTDKNTITQHQLVQYSEVFNNQNNSNAVVTPLLKVASYEPRIAIVGIWDDTWRTRGKYGIYVAVRCSYGALTGSM